MDKLKKFAIGIFDSGMGGISVLADAIKLLPNERYIYYGDSNNAPYGEKSPEEVIKLSKNICDFLIGQGVKAIVVACNTATSAAIKELRRSYDIPIIGMEPALKPAVEEQPEGSIVVMATNMTLKEKKFSNLMNKYGSKANIIKVPCPVLVNLVEDGILEGKEMDKAIKNCLGDIDISTISSIVLGCTHYIFLKDSIRRILGSRVRIIDGNEGTIRHLKDVLIERSLLNDKESQERDLTIFNSKNNEEIIILSKKLLEFNLD